MATVPRTPHDKRSSSEGPARSKGQLRQDRISLAIVVAVFVVLIAAMIWLATLAPPGSGVHYSYPIVP